MGRELINVFLTFKDSLEKSNQVLRSLNAGWFLLEELAMDVNSSRINEVTVSQPICIAI